MFFIYSFIVVSFMEGCDEQLFSCPDSLTFWSMCNSILVEPELISRLTFKVIVFTSHSCSYDYYRAGDQSEPMDYLKEIRMQSRKVLHSRTA